MTSCKHPSDRIAASQFHQMWICLDCWEVFGKPLRPTWPKMPPKEILV